MTDTSLVRLSAVRETTAGTTPGSPRMRLATAAGISLDSNPSYQQSALLRADRMNADAELSGEVNGGSIAFEFTYPRSLWPASEMWRSLFNSTWLDTPMHDNDGTADSACTGVALNNGIFTVTDQSGSGGFAGTAYAVRHLVRMTDFGLAANNGIFRVTANGATQITCAPTTTAAEAAPPAAARMKVVGFEGASGDITATATGLGSTALDFTTLGLRVGQWIKIGGTGATFRFATEALNDWARITGITATALTLDNRPAGWGTDAGTTRTIRVWFGDVIRNGTTETALSLEKGYMGQAVPNYVLQAGMHVVSGDLALSAKQKVTGSFGFLGMASTSGTTSIDASPDAEADPETYPIFTCSTNVGRVSEGGAALAGPNFCRSMRWTWNNNSRSQEAIDRRGAVGVGMGRADLSITLDSYFGDGALLAKARAGTVTSLSVLLRKANAAGTNMAVLLTAPRCKLMGFPSAAGPDQDSMLSLTAMPSRDTLTNAHYQMDRLEYFEP